MTRLCQNCRLKGKKKCSKTGEFVPRKNKINGIVPAKDCKWFTAKK